MFSFAFVLRSLHLLHYYYYYLFIRIAFAILVLVLEDIEMADCFLGHRQQRLPWCKFPSYPISKDIPIWPRKEREHQLCLIPGVVCWLHLPKHHQCIHIHSHPSSGTSERKHRHYARVETHPRVSVHANNVDVLWVRVWFWCDTGWVHQVTSRWCLFWVALVQIAPWCLISFVLGACT